MSPWYLLGLRKFTRLHAEAEIGTAETIRKLVDAGANVNARYHSHGWTPLHVAAAFGTTETVGALINAGANVNAKAKEGKTPLHFAALDKRVETIRLLAKAGADLDARHREGWTALHFAAYRAADTACALIEAGADVRARHKDGWTPLHVVGGCGKPASGKVVHALVAAGADIEATMPRTNATPLHIAASGGDAEVVNALIEAGANTKARMKDGMLPVDLARDNDALRGDPVYWVLNVARLDRGN